MYRAVSSTLYAKDASTYGCSGTAEAPGNRRRPGPGHSHEWEGGVPRRSGGGLVRADGTGAPGAPPASATTRPAPTAAHGPR